MSIAKGPSEILAMCALQPIMMAPTEAIAPRKDEIKSVARRIVLASAAMITSFERGRKLLELGLRGERKFRPKFRDLARNLVGMPILLALQAVAALHAPHHATRNTLQRRIAHRHLRSIRLRIITHRLRLARRRGGASISTPPIMPEAGEATAIAPREAVAWSNLAVTLIINASEGGEMQLGVAPTGEARKQLEEALTAIDTAESLGSSPDALNLNAKGNALGLLLQWSDARAAYEASGDAADRSFVHSSFQ